MTAFFEDVEVGSEVVFGDFTFEREHIKAFARRYDPQRFHIDEEAAKETHFGALCASGWQTAAIWMKLVVAYNERNAKAAADAGRSSARLGPSPGFTDLKWLKPVYPGDTLTYGCTIAGKRESASRPEWGLVTQHNWANNQNGERVFEFVATVFWERKPR